MRIGDLRYGIYQSFFFFGKIFCSELDMPFAKWTKEQVCNWLQDQGLGSYISNGKHWILSGQTLLQASQQDLEKVRSTGNCFQLNIQKIAVSVNVNHVCKVHPVKKEIIKR